MSWFKKREEVLPTGWTVLHSEQQMNEAIGNSHHKPAAFFKHSTRCGVSSMVKAGLVRGWDIGTDALDFLYLDLLANRELSNALADISNVQHESPQLILYRNGAVVHHASHHRISLAVLKELIT